MFQPIMAGSAKFNNRRLLQQEDTIRRMRGMTGFTISFLYRTMGQGALDHSPFGRSIFSLLFFRKPPLRFHRIRMTLSTEAFHLPHQKLLLLGGMGLMTVQTAHFIHQRPVHPIFTECFIHHIAVAPSTQLIPCPLSFKWGRRSGCFMALVTHPVGHRSVNIVE